MRHTHYPKSLRTIVISDNGHSRKTTAKMKYAMERIHYANNFILASLALKIPVGFGNFYRCLNSFPPPAAELETNDILWRKISQRFGILNRWDIAIGDIGYSKGQLFHLFVASIDYLLTTITETATAVSRAHIHILFTVYVC
ncbi:hypothetical protein ES703_104627 [subsurface metagenome]